PIVGTRFQVLFTPLFGVLFTFPSRYSFTIGLPGVFSLGGWCRRIQAGFLRSRPTQGTTTTVYLARTGLSPISPSFPPGSGSVYGTTSWPYNPTYAVTYMVWAVPRSLATTCGITLVFFSCAYLDVSVQRVRFRYR